MPTWELRDFSRFVDGAIQQAKRDEERKFEAVMSNIQSGMSNLYVDPFARVECVSGPEREQRLLYALDHMIGPDGEFIKRAGGQKKFHDAMVLACMEQLYKNDLTPNLPSIIRRYKLNGPLKSIATILSFRRGGKTWALAMFAVAYATSVENSTLTLFSTGARASQLALTTIMSFLNTYDGGKWRDRIVKRTDECIYLRVGKNDLRKIYALPAEPKISVLFLFFFTMF